ncbi:hypothetical protein DBR32_14300 [Taibaiella sp. KBW10]|uniref:hypothetical protein n=1 Tax=Taibaiella sp. KBW10 TaxID=2153357 RepID=UPI000F5B6CFE|nr:hypothetical protein [Taibaiella sp. KBW10]RQO29753.1 hypothetical protein DBR32_14300 [Taibaiella sp. KBW10]
MLFVLLGSSVRAQTIVSAKTDAQKIVLGDQFHLFIEVKHHPKDGQLFWADLPTLKGLEIVDTGKVDSAVSGNEILYKQKLTLTGFDSGVYAIPKMSFKVVPAEGDAKAYDTDSFIIGVQTVAVDTSKAIKPIKEIIPVAKEWWEYWPWVAGGLAAVALIVLFIYLWRHRKVKAVKEQRAPEKAHEKALRMLAEIARTDYFEQGKIKEYYTDLTNVLRMYMEDRFGIAAAELTTDELLKLAKNQRDLKKIRSELKQIFLTADLAKFAKASPDQAEHMACMDAATKIINKTKAQQEEGLVS